MKTTPIRTGAGTIAAILWIVALAAFAPAQPEDGPPPGPPPGDAPSTSSLSSTPLANSTPGAADELRFNFKGVPLDTVLDYLSRAAGFTIVRTVEVSGRVNVVSQNAVTPDEAVEILDTVLAQQGYAAIRTEKTLKIIRKDKAATSDIPVRQGNDPEAIERGDQIVTQIIPVRHTNAKELVDNLKPLLPETAVLTSNEKSNALILTDTQTSVRRIVEIVLALDQSISEITSLEVFHLQYADAKSTADMVKELFKAPTASSSGDNRERRFTPPWMGRSGDDNDGDSSGSSPALQAASTVTAAADERTNSIAVSAPEETMPAIADLIAQIDKSADALTEVRVFPLQFADATQTAEVITNVFGQQSAQTTSARSGNDNSRRSGRSGFFSRMMGGGNQGGSNQTVSARQLQEITVVAVADTRTNSVVVTAIPGTMEQIAEVVENLDKNPAKTKRVYTYTLQNADPQEVSTTLQQMFGTQGSTTNRNTTNRNTTNRNTTNRNTNNNSSNRSSNSSNTSRSR